MYKVRFIGKCPRRVMGLPGEQRNKFRVYEVQKVLFNPYQSSLA
jgi:hypothetical protein